MTTNPLGVIIVVMSQQLISPFYYVAGLNAASL